MHLKVIYCFFLLFVNEQSFYLLNDAKTFPRTQKDRPKLNFYFSQHINTLSNRKMMRGKKFGNILFDLTPKF